MLREHRWLGAQIPLPLEKRLLPLLWQFGLLSQTRWKLRVQITEAVFHEFIKRIPKLFHFALRQRHRDTVMFTAPTVYSGTEWLFFDNPCKHEPPRNSPQALCMYTLFHQINSRFSNMSREEAGQSSLYVRKSMWFFSSPTPTRFNLFWVN